MIGINLFQEAFKASLIVRVVKQTAFAFIISQSLIW